MYRDSLSGTAMTSAPAKIILFGEHAVVYGEPALAAPVVQLRARAAVEPGNGLTIVSRHINEMLSEVVDNPLAQMAQLTLQFLNAQPPDVTITITSDIPIASGLGSGAAVSAALGRAIAEAVGRTIDDSDLNRLVYEIERIHHGTPSGVDNTVIVYERPVFFVRDKTLETLVVGKPFTLLIADTGKSALTHHAVGDVRVLYQTQAEFAYPLIQKIGDISRSARRAVEMGDTAALGHLADENHSLLQQLTVSSPELDTLVAAAKAAGAYGAKLSGGGRGGNMIAFVDEAHIEKVRRALLEAGAVRVIETVIR
jgi:mevalonate kinase